MPIEDFIGAREEEKQVQEVQPKETLGKELTLGVAAIFLALLSWGMVLAILNNTFFFFDQLNVLRLDIDTVTLTVVTALLFCLYLATTLFFFLFTRRVLVLIAALLMALLPIAVGALIAPHPLLFAGGILYFIVLYAWFKMTKKARDNQRDFSLSSLLRHGLTLIIAVVLLNVSLLYYTNFQIRNGDATRLQATTIDVSVAAANNIMTRLIEGYRGSMTVDDFIILLGESTAPEDDAIGDADDVLDRLSELLGTDPLGTTVTMGAMKEQKAAARESFFESLGLERKGFTGTSTMNDVWGAYIEDRITVSFEKYERIIPWIVAVSVFLSLLIFKFAYKIIVFIYAWFILKILLFFRFFAWEISKQPVKRLIL